MSKYRFFIEHDSVTVEVFPLYDNIKFSYKKEGVRFRKELKTVFTFVKSDFTTILAIENGLLRCNEINFEIKISCDKGATYTSHWLGSLSINDGSFDLDKCTYSFTPAIIDKYSCILKNINKEYNLLLSGPLVTIKNITDFNFEFYYGDITGVSQPVTNPNDLRICFPPFPTPSPENATWTELYTDIACYDFDCTAYVGTLIIYVRERVLSVNIGGVSTPPNGAGWVEVSGSNNGTTTTYVRAYTGLLPDIGIRIVKVACNGTPTVIGGLSYVKLFFGNLLSNCADSFDWYWSPPNASKTYTQFRALYDAMLYLINRSCPLNTLSSDFFEWNPVGDAPGYVSGLNYVTGLNNVINKSLIAQKSDIVNPTATQKATIGMITLKTLMDNLKSIFNVDWFIDDLGRFRIEHIKYFTFTLGYDTSDTINLKWNAANNKYTYKKEEMPSIESFQFMESQGIDFVGKNITYTSECTINEGENNTNQYLANRVTTDISYIENQPTDISNDGFVIAIYNSVGGVNYIAKEEGKLTGALIANAHLSWANLHYNYHRYGRVLLTGNMNGVDQSFFTAKKNKVQSNVKLQICCDEAFDPTGILIQTELGTGEIENAEEENNIVKLQINL